MSTRLAELFFERARLGRLLADADEAIAVELGAAPSAPAPVPQPSPSRPRRRREPGAARDVVAEQLGAEVIDLQREDARRRLRRNGVLLQERTRR